MSASDKPVFDTHSVTSCGDFVADGNASTGTLQRGLGRLSLACYKTLVRIRAKCFSLLISGGFASFGKHSVLMYPIRIYGERHIAIGDRVFIGPGSWLQTLTNGGKPGLMISIGNGTSIVGDCVISAAQKEPAF